MELPDGPFNPACATGKDWPPRVPFTHAAVDSLSAALECVSDPDMEDKWYLASIYREFAGLDNGSITISVEPTSALDPEMIKEVLDVMRDLATSGYTIVAVTHEMGFAREVADRVIFFDQGLIVEQNAPAEFFSNPLHERSRLFLSQILQH